ncbi:MAG: ABC transporter permease [Ardenticatenaceae bacterium]|nr:ABC transporter permease [Ardenticatenaceae bacterium]
MKAITIAHKFLRELWREPQTLLLLVLFPTVLLGFYYLAFGGSTQSLATFLTIQVLDQDEGEMGEALTAVLSNATFAEQPMFNVIRVNDQRRATIALRERKAALLLIIPPDFSASLTAQSPNATLQLVGDTNADSFIFAESLLVEVAREFGAGIVGVATAVPLTYDFLPGTGTMSDFDFGVSGIIVFGLVLLVVSTAQPLVQEYNNGTLRRLRLAPVRARDLLLGLGLAQMVVAAALIPLTFAAAVLMGFRGNGSLLLAVGVGLLFCLSVIGLGLVTASFARSDGEAANLGASLGVLMVLMSGAMYPMPEANLFTVNGRIIQLYDLLPTAHAAEALRRILIFGDGLADIGYELVMLALLAALILGAGIVLYQRRRMQNR